MRPLVVGERIPFGETVAVWISEESWWRHVGRGDIRTGCAKCASCAKLDVELEVVMVDDVVESVLLVLIQLVNFIPHNQLSLVVVWVDPFRGVCRRHGVHIELLTQHSHKSIGEA